MRNFATASEITEVCHRNELTASYMTGTLKSVETRRQTEQYKTFSTVLFFNKKKIH